MSHGKVIIIRLMTGLIKKDLVWFYWMQSHCIKLSQYFPKPYEPFGGDITVKVVFQIMQRSQTLKIFHMLILQVSH